MICASIAHEFHYFQLLCVAIAFQYVRFSFYGEGFRHHWREILAASGLKRGLAVAFFAGSLFAASFAFPGKAEGAAVSPGGARHPAETGVYYDDEAVGPDAPGHASRADTATNEQTMLASYYGRSLEGRPTASGEPFDADAHTAAHKSLPLGTRLRVNHGGESVRVTVNDRGPYVAGRDIDLSLAAAREIGLTYPGTAPVQVVVL